MRFYHIELILSLDAQNQYYRCKVHKIMKNKEMHVQFWGVRGTLPVPGPQAFKYGGNTNCVTLCIADQHWFIFDAGTGIKKFSDYLKTNKKLPIKANLFITHPHWDHINCLPYFEPFYIPGNAFDIFSGCHDETTIEKLIFSQMDNVYFPITAENIEAKLSFRKLEEEAFNIQDIHIESMRLSHPGICLGYKVQYKNKIFCYITDNELFLKNTPEYDPVYVEKLIKFIDNADILIVDATYSDEEYKKKVTWGHSCVSQVVDLADRAKVKKMCLFHHDPSQSDDDIDVKLKMAQSLLRERNSITQCIAPAEGDVLILKVEQS